MVDAVRSTDFDAFVDVDSAAHNRLTLLVLGAVGAVGGLVGTAALLPYADELGMSVAGTLAVGALLVALGVFAVLLPRRVPGVAIDLLLAAAVGVTTLAVSMGAAQVAGHTVLIYLWVAALAAMFRPERATLYQFIWISVAAAAVFALDGTFADAWFWWLVVVSALVVAWHSIGWLVHRARRLAQQAHEMRNAAEQASAELEDAIERKGRFMARMSHELRTPMNAIVGYSDLLHRGVAGDLTERQVQYVDDILASARHLSLLVDDTLNETAEPTAEVLDRSTTTPDLLIDGAVTLVRGDAASRGIRIRTSIESSESLLVDERKVTQILVNLLSNAVRFTQDGDEVEVSARVVGDRIEFSVTDHGPGIDPADHESIFEEFRQIDGAQQRFRGSGLGLSLARRLVELHGGHIDVESEPDHGAHFFFTIPIDPASSPGTASESGTERSHSVGTGRVVGVRELVRRSFIFSGAVIIVALAGGLFLDGSEVSSTFLLASAGLIAGVAALPLIGLWVLPSRMLVVLNLLLYFGGAIAIAFAYYHLGAFAPAAAFVWFGQAFYVRLLFMKLGVRGTWGHLLLVTGGAGIVLMSRPGTIAPVAQWMAVTGTVWAWSFQVGWLILRLQRIAEAERAATLEATTTARELEATSAHRSRFLAGTSHELRTPLNAVIGFAEALQRGVAGPLSERQREYVADVEEAGRHLLRLVGDVLDLARVDAGRLEVQILPVDVATVVQDAVESLQDAATARDVQLVTRAEPGQMISADRALLGRALSNVVANAIEASPPGEDVIVAVRADPRWTHITVRDVGPGVRTEDRDAIFEEYKSDADDPTKSQKGVGLGLPIARRFVGLQGGRIVLETRTIGPGAEFRIDMPNHPCVQTALADGAVPTEDTRCQLF